MMDRLLTTLAGLVVGLRGTRRAALDEIVFLLREEWDILRRTLDSMDDMAARRIEELNVALKDLVDERAEVDRLRNHLAVLREENERLLGQMLRQGMELDAANETLRKREAHIRALAAGGHTLTVKRRLLKDYKIACIKAVRFSGMSLKDAKEHVEALATVPDEWIVLVQNLDAHSLVLALKALTIDTLSLPSPAPPTPSCPESVRFD